jgi:hypothetical protein
MDVSDIRPKYKDWNEILKAMNGCEPLPAVPNLALNKMRELIKEIVPKAIECSPLLYPYKTVSADYKRLMASTNSEQITKSANLLARDTIRMARKLLNTDEKELMHEIFDQYLQHTDKACFENKMKNVKSDMEIVEKLFGTDQIRIASELEQNVQSLYKLACDSLRIVSHIELKQTANFTEEQNEGSEEMWEMQQG